MSKVLVLTIAICLWWGLLESARGESKPIFETLKTRYLKLRNTDNQIGKPKEWRGLAGEFLAAVKRYPKDSSAASAILNASIMYEELFRAEGKQDDFALAVEHLNRIPRDYPGHELADDALLRRGDLLLFDARRPRAARRSYQEIVEVYPDSDMYDVAVARLDSLEHDKESPPVQDDQAQELEDERADRQTVIVLDPGHGGEDLGAIGPAQLLEKDVVLAIAFELRDLLLKEPNIKVVLTRSRDDFIPLAERTAVANAAKADVFVSLHANASVRKNLSGFEIYYLDNAGDKASKTLAERENASEKLGGSPMNLESSDADLHFMLSDLIQHGKRDDSIALANAVRSSFRDYLSPRWDQIRDLGVKRAPFFVLVGAHMPCVLVEMFFIDHKVDGVRLTQKKFRADLAQALQTGILAFLKTRAP
ncbi:MAG: N-acetylmuramoyl-L-alanine amidase [Bdellovibrionales bacterium]|nr:N-acetylmuramoyl-L-alanine amidase [Bdellovibrionales bacterium]